MASIAKVITVIGSSPDGFAEAAQVAVSEAGKTLRGIHGAQVVSMSCDVTDDKITNFKTTVNIAFEVER
jgi:dodecin